MQTEKRTLRWGTLVPAVCNALLAVLLFTGAVMPAVPFAVTAGVLCLAAGAVSAVAYFLGQDVHFLRMLAGTVQACTGIWSAASCTNYSYSVFALGMGIVYALLAAAAAVGAVRAAKERAYARCAVGAVLALLWAVFGVLQCIHRFAAVFSPAGVLYAAAAVLLTVCAAEGLSLWAEGLYTSETLTFRKSVEEEEK